MRSAVAHLAELAERAVQLHIAFAVGPRRNWLNLWKPHIETLDPLVGRTIRGATGTRETAGSST